MEKIRVTIEYGDGEVKEFTGTAVVGTVIGVGDQEERCAGIFVGKGSAKNMLVRAALTLGGMVRDVVEGEFDQLIVAGLMSKLMLDAASGDSDLSETISKEHKSTRE